MCKQTTYRWTLLMTLSLFGCVCVVNCTKYYLTRNELRKRLDESKRTSGAKDPIHTSNSNTYFVEDGYGYDSHEVGDYGDHQDHYPHRYVVAEKKYSKFFGDEISFVIVVVTLTVFFGILSSLLIPLTLLLLNGGGGGLSPFGGLNGILPVTGIGGIAPGIVGRRRRSIGSTDRMTEYVSRFDSALGKFNK